MTVVCFFLNHEPPTYSLINQKSESQMIVGLLEVIESGFFSSEFIDSFAGDATHAYARGLITLAAPASAASLLTPNVSSSVCAPASCSTVAVVAPRATCTIACCTEFSCVWWFLACAEIHLLEFDLAVCNLCPTGRSGTKVLVSSPSEDLRPVSEVEAGVSFRTAGSVRGQGGDQGQATGCTGSAVTPSVHPEVPGAHFVLPGRG